MIKIITQFIILYLVIYYIFYLQYCSTRMLFTVSMGFRNSKVLFYRCHGPVVHQVAGLIETGNSNKDLTDINQITLCWEFCSALSW